MKNFEELLKQDISQYEGRHDDFIYFAPNLYSLLVHLLDDPRLPVTLRPLISCAIAYFILPVDIISENIYGPYGYIDDIWLCAYVADHVRKNTSNENILEENWNGESPIIPFIDEVLKKEKELIGEERDKILKYTGCSQLIE